MTATSFQPFLGFIWAGDNDGRRDDSAPGEPFVTVKGVTQMTWDAAVADGLVTGQLQDATDDQLAAIYQVRFWNACRCDELPPGVDLMVANDAVLAGPGHAARLLQRCVGTAPDGVIGPLTLQAVNRRVPGQALVRALHDANDQFFASLATAPMFLAGWSRREDQAQALALELIANGENKA